MEQLIKTAEGILSSCLAVKEGEEVLIVTDDTRKRIGEALYEAAGNLGCERLLMVMKERELSGQEPPKAVAAAMKNADVVVAPTAQSLTHTNARIEAAKAGTRVATMPGITEEMFSKGAMTADYDQVEKLTEVITEKLTKASEARIEAVKEGEEVLIVTDDTRKRIGEALYEAAGNLGCERLLMVMKERELSGQEPPKAVAAAMKNADVVVAPTAQSLTHTNARIEAAKAGTRVATMPGITEEMFSKGAMTADYDQVEKLTEVITEKLTKASEARIEKDGKVLKISLKGRNGVPSPGVYKKPGQCGNLPSGEAYIAPLENGSEGEMIIDGSMVGIGKLESPLHMVISGGRLRSVTGEKSENLDVLLKNETNGTLCELGIGTNEAAILNGIILEDEKVYGTVHIAFGTNTSFGGVNKAECHMDGIILRPTLYLDNEKIIEDGVFCI